MWTFTPIYKRPIWGGTQLPAYKGDADATGSIGESWEVSDVPGSVSVVADGPDRGLTLDQLIARDPRGLLGRHVFEKYGSRFPLLIKLIDARADLSVQVHPDDDMARRMGHPFGKNEMWVVLRAKPGARLADGFIQPIDPRDLDNLVETGRIVDTLRYSPVHPGSAFYIPAGRVHAIGAGILLAEIQQTSDDTFRLYDYNRTDAQGHRRQLHLPQARQAIRYADVDGQPLHYSTAPDKVSTVCASPYFHVGMVRATEHLFLNYLHFDSFVIFLCIGGEAILRTHSAELTLRRGRTALIAASDACLEIIPRGRDEFRALEIHIPEDDA